VGCRSPKLTAIVCDSYPIIIFDEFQDTNAAEWQMIRLLGAGSRLITLADAEQRIYEFRSADPARIAEFAVEYEPTQFAFGAENNRNNGTDIVAFGNDLLTTANRMKTYRDVTMTRYPLRQGLSTHLDLKVKVIERIRRLKEGQEPHWSLAILVPTKALMLEVSTYLESEQVFPNFRRLPSVFHEVALETAGPALAAVIIAGVLEGAASAIEISQRLVIELCNHLRGRKGDEQAAREQLDLAKALGNYAVTGTIRGSRRTAVANDCRLIGETRRQLELSGDPAQDWLAVRRLFEKATTDALKKVAYDARYLRLLHKGALLRSRLSEIWRTSRSYSGAASAVQDALLQEHFAASTKDWQGIHLMTIHKAKGKEFDEVIIYEGCYQGRFVRANATDREIAQSGLALRVAVTRAKKHATILTSRKDPCRFF
jgi:DNA helicase-2/ATP-dependent DNA helicase PcrA